MSCYKEFGWSVSEVRECLECGAESERLAVYFEEIGAYEYQQMKKYEKHNTGGAREITEFELEDQEQEIWVPDENEV